MRYFLENRISAYMLFAGIMIFGVMGLRALPLALMPQVNYPALSVIIEYPGMTPERMESVVTRPVERVLRTVPGIENIHSVSEEGRSRLNIEFHLDTDVRIASLRIREKIGLIRDTFPRAVQEPVVVRYDPSDRPAVIMSLEKIPGRDATQAEVRDYAERIIKPVLQRIDGVSEVIAAGGLRREIHIDVDDGKFSSRALDFGTLFAMVQGGNLAVPGGTAVMNGREYSVRTPGRFLSPGDIAGTVLYHDDSGRSIRLSDCARVADAFRAPEDIARLNGQERVMLYVHRAGDANLLSVCDDVERVLAQMPGCEIRTVYSQGRYIRSAIGNVVRSGVWGLFIVVMVVYAFYRSGARAAIIGLSIPVSVMAVFACMHFAGIPIDVVSLSGLALSAGMVVDNSILVSGALPDTGLNPATACAGARSVRASLVASTATTVAVFFPVVFGDAMTRRLYSGMAFTVTSALLVSLAVALVLVPALHLDIVPASGSWIRMMVLRSGSLRACGRAAGAFGMMASITARLASLEYRALGMYRTALATACARPRRIYAAAGLVVAISIACLCMLKSEFNDPFGGGEFYIHCEFPTGTTLAATDRAVKLAEQHVVKLGIAERVSARIEKGKGTIVVTPDGHAHGGAARGAIMKKTGEDLNALFSPSHGFAYVTEAEESASRELSITFTGGDNDTLREIARDAARRIRALRGIDDCVLRFREGKPSYRLVMDRDKSGMSGVSVSQLASFMHNALFGPVISKLIDADREVDVRVRFARDTEPTVDRILGFPVPCAGGMSVTAGELVRVEEGTDHTRIWRTNGRRSVTITARIGALSFEEAASGIGVALAGLGMPAEYAWEFDGTLEKSRGVRTGMLVLTVMSILLVFMIIAGLLESVRLPLVIMLTVPLSYAGAFIALFAAGFAINSAVLIGLIILTGTAVNNGIVLVAKMNDACAGMPAGGLRRGTRGAATEPAVFDVVRNACLAHFRPVAATTVTTVVGFLPALLSGGEGSALWRPLALTVIAGLTVSTSLTLVLMPPIYIAITSAPVGETA